MPDDFVRNDEILYRRILASRKLYKIKTDGTIEISSEAFSDRQLRVSVDRAKLCDNNPRQTLGNEPGVVVGLLTSDVRNVDDLTRNDRKGNPLFQFKIDVEPVPLSGNSAHAEIYAIPAFADADRRGAFHRLCRRLVRIVEAKQSILLFDDQQI
ncbi:MAG TPA: hypothetical protein VEL70_09490 [Candidatus Acidoferrum sp.]|nr:hypothetical protein [Candidatus Acidoferrum sp.]